VRRDLGEAYQEFLTRLAQASGIRTPTRADLARLDRKRPKKGRNKDWRHPHDPDARITKMKDGRPHLAPKAEHAVDTHLKSRMFAACARARLFDISPSGAKRALAEILPRATAGPTGDAQRTANPVGFR
jgi:hypothetical protein